MHLLAFYVRCVCALRNQSWSLNDCAAGWAARARQASGMRQRGVSGGMVAVAFGMSLLRRRSVCMLQPNAVDTAARSRA